jgi:hypothetical protein
MKMAFALVALAGLAVPAPAVAAPGAAPGATAPPAAATTPAAVQPAAAPVATSGPAGISGTGAVAAATSAAGAAQPRTLPADVGAGQPRTLPAGVGAGQPRTLPAGVGAGQPRTLPAGAGAGAAQPRTALAAQPASVPAVQPAAPVGAPAAAPAALVGAPAAPTAQPSATTARPAATAAAPTLVARYTFDAGVVGGRVADTSGRGQALTIRSVDQGAVRFEAAATGRYLSFPAACPSTATTCPRALLEAPNDGDLNPGSRFFRWSARIQLTKAQITGSANIMQKGVATTASQWKMQVGRTNGRAQCVAVGTGSATTYVARSTSSVADGQWHKILCQRSGSTLSVYVDGVAQGQTAIPANLNLSNTMPLRLGGPNFNTKTDMYHGRLDDVYAELG